MLQNGANLRYALRILIADLPNVRNVAQVSENPRKNSFLNYESPALTAELQARFDRGLKHSIPRQPTLEPWAGQLAKISDCGLWIADLGWSRDSRNLEHN